MVKAVIKYCEVEVGVLCHVIQKKELLQDLMTQLLHFIQICASFDVQPPSGLLHAQFADLWSDRQVAVMTRTRLVSKDFKTRV